MLKQRLREVHTPNDISRLFHSLGYQPECQLDHDGSIRVARWKGFRVIAVSAEEAADAARSLAARLARHSQRAMAVALSADRRLALAAPRLGQPGATRVLTVHLDDPSPFAIQQLERLRPKRTANALAHALSVADVLSSEQVGEVSGWPSRTEQLSILLGQVLRPGASLAGQLTGPAGALASQIQR